MKRMSHSVYCLVNSTAVQAHRQSNKVAWPADGFTIARLRHSGRGEQRFRPSTQQPRPGQRQRHHLVNSEARSGPYRLGHKIALLALVQQRPRGVAIGLMLRAFRASPCSLATAQIHDKTPSLFRCLVVCSLLPPSVVCQSC